MSGTTIYTDKSQESVLFNNAELATPADMNNTQYLRERRVVDYMFAHQHLDAFDPGSFPVARPLGGAFSIRQAASVGMTVRVYPGTLFFKSAADPGQPAPQWLMHRMGSIMTVTVDTADATNPRRDLLSYKVEYDSLDTGSVDADARVTKTVGGTYTSQTLDKRRRTKLTVTYTPGAPGVSPVPPSTPAGQVAFAVIEVPATDTTISTTQILDYRTPAGAVTVRRRPDQGYTQGSNRPTDGFWNASSGFVSEVFYYYFAPDELRGMDITDAVSTADGHCLAHYRLKRVRVKAKITGSSARFFTATVDGGSLIEDVSSQIVSGVDASYTLTPTYPLWSMGGADAGSKYHRNPWTSIDVGTGGEHYGGNVYLHLQAGATNDLVYPIMAEWYGL